MHVLQALGENVEVIECIKAGDVGVKGRRDVNRFNDEQLFVEVKRWRDLASKLRVLLSHNTRRPTVWRSSSRSASIVASVCTNTPRETPKRA